MTAIREATPTDLDAIMRLEIASFPTDAWSSTLMQSELESEHNHYFVLEDAGDVIGYAGLRALKGDPNSDVQTIAVAEHRRGHGDGRALLRALLHRAIASGAKHVFLDVRDDNLPARTLYAAEGFVEIGRRPHYYQPDDVDAVVMQLSITAAIEEKLT